MGGSALREGLGKEPGLPSNYELGAKATMTSMLLVVQKICQCNRRLLLQKSVFGLAPAPPFSAASVPGCRS